ncbi:MAG TPA: ATP-binding protein [Patescibacteria group bacterium]|jgi:signal transduction histidine kinase|nr:ATP-binding protein [Patescibacteria group bacterium]
MKRHFVLYSLLVTTVVSGVLLFAGLPRVGAVGSNIKVSVQHDKCDNIGGVQTTVPSGMISDSKNNCYTPPPPPVDVCNNLSGNQSVVPAGYFRDSFGNCYLQPVEPVDVCPNLDGVQEVVPDGYENDTNGDCVKKPVDQCLNIDGVQESMPDGMKLDAEGACSTPPLVTTPEEPTPPTTATPPTQEAVRVPVAGEPPKNIPVALAPVVKPIVDAVPEPIKQIVRSLPPVVAQSFPYYVFAALGTTALVLWFQAFREARAAQYFASLLSREQSIAEQKDNFIALASHYLQTPLAVMSNGLDAIQALKEIPPENLEPLRGPITRLGDNIKSILKEVEGNLSESGIENPTATASTASFLKSPFFWGPVAASIGIIVLANFLLGVVGEVEIGTLNILTQIIVFTTVGFFLYSSVRNHYTRKRNRAKQEELLEHERTIDETRNTFLARSTTTLQNGLSELGTLRNTIAAAPSAKFFDDGYNRFATMLGKFTLLSQIRAGTPIQMQPIDLHASIDDAIGRRAAEAAEKEITITNETPAITISQHNDLFQFVIDSLLDNAIKFTDNGGSITVDATPGQHTISVSVKDTGVGIATEKQLQLFKPFSRTESAVEFNYEGLGFSLFLDKIIMDYLGGDISVESKERAGSTFSITSDSYFDTNKSSSSQPMAQASA